MFLSSLVSHNLHVRNVTVQLLNYLCTTCVLASPHGHQSIKRASSMQVGEREKERREKGKHFQAIEGTSQVAVISER